MDLEDPIALGNCGKETGTLRQRVCCAALFAYGYHSYPGFLLTPAAHYGIIIIAEKYLPRQKGIS